MVAEIGFEPTTFGLWARRATNCSTPRHEDRIKFHLRLISKCGKSNQVVQLTFKWRAKRDSNPRGPLSPWRFSRPLPSARLGYLPIWWSQQDLNLQPTGYEPGALTNWAIGPQPVRWTRFHMVAPKGVEPLTFRVWTECSNHLSYSAIMVERKGVEPSTSCVQGRRSSQVSYPPMVKKTGFEPATTWSQTRCSAKLSYFSTFC